MKNGHITLSAILILFSGSYSCKKLVAVDPPTTKVTAGSVFSTDATAIAVLTGMYNKISSAGFAGTPALTNISYYTGLSADELTIWSGGTAAQLEYYKNALSANVTGSEFWTNTYPLIYSCNAAIEGLTGAKTLTPAIKQQLLGEAKFLRGLFYLHLVNLYGDVPLVLTTDITVTATMARTPKADVYTQITTDLTDAQSLLIDGYAKGDAITAYPAITAERVRPDKAAATALLARVYLYTHNWSKAKDGASAIIGNTSYYSLVPLNSVFLKNSREAIWQLQPVGGLNLSNSPDAPFYIIPFSGPGVTAGVNSSHPVYLSTNLLNAFEAGDQRKTIGNWINVYTDPTGTYFYPYKYKATSTTTVTPTEYTMILRLGEQYLIRAEAEARMGDSTSAIIDLNAIRTRAGLAGYDPSLQGPLLAAILHERQVELFAESGQRWFDLKRTGSVDSVMTTVTPLKGNTWNSDQSLYPLPLADLSNDPHLIQNPGY